MATTDSPPPPSDMPSSSSSSSPYPYAFAPDIIRAHQKDAYFQGLLTHQITDLHRRLLGARSAHSWGPESSTVADLLYLCLTTLLGNRTLGEEYCGLVQVEEGAGGRLPALPRRAAYIAGSILVPYGVASALPKLRARIRDLLERNLARASQQQQQQHRHRQERRPAHPADTGTATTQPPTSRPRSTPWTYTLQSYALANLATLTSPAPVHALGLALFYFSGSYYELSKRMAGLRYIFTYRVGESSDRAGYELLGVLLVVQMAVQGYLHVRSTLMSASFSPSSSISAEAREHSAAASHGGMSVSLDANAYTTNNELLVQMGTPGGGGGNGSAQPTRIDLLGATHTPPVPQQRGARYDLADEKTMRWVSGAQQRKCTLCLEELKDPAATQCGHVFCWGCIGDWVREKPECPLCRREAMVQHILPLRAV